MNRLFENFNNLLPLNRKERFYTGSVLPAIICYGNFKYIDRFFNLIPNFNLNLEIKPDVKNNNILFQTEYSFKESLVEKHFKEKFTGDFETKDTPDLVILITEPELVLIVGEAKMFSSVNPGDINTQMKNQEWFIEAVKNGLNIKNENCFHFALLPQKLIPGKASLNYPVVFWEEIISSYNEILADDYFLNVLRVAVDKFDDLRSQRNGDAISFGKNMDFKLSGDKILEMHNNGESFWVGRSKGRFGDKFKTDILTGGWKDFEYEINKTSKSVPNRNWFSSSQFVNDVGEKKTNSDSNSEKSQSVNSGINNPYFNSELSDWHFSHLGRDYFLDISRKIGGDGKWDAPIDSVYIGKSGVRYIEKKRGRNVNPNWSVILKNGREIKCKTVSGMIENGSWGRANCNVFSWQEIKEFFENQFKIKI
jgi:hypothetical protein